MLAVHRFRVTDEDAFRLRLAEVVAVFGSRPGFVGADHGRNVDEADLWVLVTRWEDVGSYRRALGSYDAKVALAPLMEDLLHEPSAYAD